MGKTAIQVAHAAVLSAEKSRQTDFATFSRWLDSGQAKVVLKVRSLEELVGLRQAAEELSLLVVLIEDTSPKQVVTGLWNCICIGPAQSTLIDKVTRHLKLL
jgi:PTH2 family peptidyl-tRNA hydrolase